MGQRLVTALTAALRALTVAGVPYALIGGLAAAVRGRLRLTRDLDLLVLCERTDLERLIRAFQDHGFAHHPRADRHRLDEVLLLRFWLQVDSSAVSIGVDVQVLRNECLRPVVERASTERYQNVEVRVATREDLVLLVKLRARRPIDQADARELLQTGEVDSAYLARQASELGLTERLEEVLKPN